MGNERNNPRRGRRGIIFLFPLVFLLIFVFTQSLAGFFVSMAIIAMLWAIMVAAWFGSRMWNTPNMPPPCQYPAELGNAPPGREAPDDQGYMLGGSSAQRTVPQQPWEAPQSQPYPYQEPSAASPGPGPGEEGDRLARLKLLGDLHTSGVLTDDEFERQKQHILRSS